jgi:predicted DCC family thiol-disulfide oxidoreductase YuxK
VKSTAVLGMLRHLPWPWSWLAVGRVVPRSLRDRLYDLLARHRYRWFGRRETCMLPTPDTRARFLDEP